MSFRDVVSSVPDGTRMLCSFVKCVWCVEKCSFWNSLMGFQAWSDPGCYFLKLNCGKNWEKCVVVGTYEASVCHSFSSRFNHLKVMNIPLLGI